MFTLPLLSFEKDALNPIISSEGIDYHYGKHHKTYVDNLNNLVCNTPYATMALENIIIRSHQEQNNPLYNNAAQHYNHSFFWQCITVPNSTTIGKQTDQLIQSKYGTFENFRAVFTEKATKLFGSGWVWLVLTDTNDIDIIALKDADTPIAFGQTPLLTIDVWEHAYYIDHRNARANFIAGFWDIINWNFVEKNVIASQK